MKLVIICFSFIVLFSCSSSKVLNNSFEPRKKTPMNKIEKKAKIVLVKEPFFPIKRTSILPEHVAIIQNSQDSLTFILPQKKLPKKVRKAIWEVQLFAISDRNSADIKLFDLLKETKLDGRIVESGGVYKVRVGRSDTRVEMDQLVSELKKKGYNTAWVVKDTIYSIEEKIPKFYFTLQVGVFSTNLNAVNLKKSLKKEFSEPITIKFVNGLYKVFLGKETKRENLEFVKDKLLTQDIKSWITEQKM